MNQRNYIRYAICLLLTLLLLAACTDELPSPKDYNVTLYAATYLNSICRTENGGKSWFSIEQDQTDLWGYFKRIYLDPHDRDALYVATTGAGIFRFNLKKEMIENVSFLGQAKACVIVFRSPSPGGQTPREILVGIDGKGVFRSHDEGAHWEPQNQGLVYRNIHVLFTTAKALYAGTVRDLFRWYPSTKQWIASSEGIRNRNIFSLGAGPEGKVLYAGSGAYGEKKGRFEKIPCLYKSTDQGLTWKASDKGIPDGTLVYAIAVNPVRPERVYAGTSEGIYRSTNAGREWLKMEQGLPKNLKAFDIKMARMPDAEDVVYAAGSSGVFMTIDDDETRWVGKSYGLPKTAITSIVIVSEK